MVIEAKWKENLWVVEAMEEVAVVVMVREDFPERPGSVVRLHVRT